MLVNIPQNQSSTLLNFLIESDKMNKMKKRASSPRDLKTFC